MDISIIIPNYKSERYLSPCVKSLLAHTLDVSCEIIIINNDTAHIKSILPGKNLHIINNETNEGFARACNKAAAIAQGKMLFFLNPDTRIISGSIKSLADTIHDSSVGIVSPQIITPSGEIQAWSAGYEISLWEILCNNFGFIRSKRLWEKNSKAQPDWTSGAALAINQSLFKKITGFDENFFMYFEDVDLCKRVRDESLKILILPSVQVLHVGGQSSSCSIQQKKYYYASQDYYFKKHFGLFSLFFLTLLRRLALPFKKLQ